MDIRGPFTESEFRSLLRAGAVPDSYIDAVIVIARQNQISFG
jgi:hypothetical protein